MDPRERHIELDFVLVDGDNLVARPVGQARWSRPFGYQRLHPIEVKAKRFATAVQGVVESSLARFAAFF